ncbi:nitrilase-related carbon-nitrogen hydrolase [uncultured Methanomethylovorans sp.]|uniref:nitrilase-related carbon-nitrogen hydrolase n=1 Tax=uncultured Methanomethylovorans sp. TaxID=183759 RepID=UPI002AA5FC69|nr:nitrilase-related carbon-nitrogen hydrolase [uncultured Methanomethylovorans sp.]
MEVAHCSKSDNLNKAMAMADKAVSSGADIVVFPELFSTGFCYEEISDLAEEAPYCTILKLLEFSKRMECVVIGSIIEKQSHSDDYAYYNLGFCVEHGILTGVYRKSHPFKKELNFFTAGNSIHPIALEKYGLTIGLEICYELRFPEVARKLALAGADLLVTAAQFPNPRRHVWRTLSLARAIENQIPHVACNLVGSSPTSSFFGGSIIIDAAGNVLAEADDAECVIMHTINTENTAKVRSAMPVFLDRRADLY